MFNKKPMSQTALNLGKDENGNAYGGAANYKSTFDISKVGDGKLEKFKPHLGDNKIDIIPFNAGPNHPFVVTGQCEEGDTVYSLDYYVHKSIGPAKQDFVCLKQYGKRCPLCDESYRLYQAATTKEEKDAATAVRNKRRCIYLVHDLIDDKIGYFDVAWFSFEKNVNSRASLRNDPATGAPINPFDWETGKTICFKTNKDKFEGNEFNKIDEATFDLIDRAPLSDNILNYSVDLSAGLITNTEDEMDAALCGKPVVSKNTQPVSQPTPQNTSVQTQTENLASQAMAAAQSQSNQMSFDNMKSVENTAPANNESSGNTCPCGHNWGDANHTPDYPECATCQLWDKCIDA